jgi:hypothetical protein
MKLIILILCLISLNVNAQQTVHGKRGIGNNATAPNLPPSVDAGVDKSITLPTNSTTFFGSGSDTYGAVVFLWTQVSGPSTATLTGSTTATLLAGNLIEGTYSFQLTVTDNKGLSSVDTTSVIVNPAINILPVANAGPDIPLTLPTNSTVITGTATDADGTITLVTWSNIGGPSSATITGATTLTPTVSNLIQGTYDFRLLVTDNGGGIDTDIMRVIVSPAIPPVNQPPVADAGSNIVITLPTNTTTLTGSGTDPDGTIVSYAWVLLTGTGGSITSPSSASTGLTGLTQGVRTYQLTVTDNLGLTDTDIVQVTVLGAANVGPTAIAGSDQSITLPTNTVTLTGSGTDTDGTIVTYAWTRQSGPVTASIVSPSSATTVVNFIEAGVYIFQLQVIDNNGASGFDAVQITVTAAPSVNTGAITFTLDTVSHVSAIITTYDSTSLVATLFSDSVMDAGTHTVYWQGKDDTLGTIQFPATKYMAKILSNNVQYDWMGTIGNNSDSSTGDTKHRGYYRCMSTLCFWGDTGYYATGYSEGSPSLGKFNANTPGTKISMPYGPLINTGDITHVCTDGTYVYWAFFDSNAGNNSAVFGTKVSDDTEVQFPAGAAFNGVSVRDYPYAISITNAANSNPSGIAVGSSYLFVARGGIDQLKVHNKTTGTLVQTLTLDSVRSIATDQSDNIWIITGTPGTVSKYPINANGTLGAATLTLTGLVQPLSVSVNRQGTVVSVSDAGTSQQVKHFNNGTGVSISTLGTAGGYFTNGATVNNSKFYFTDIDGVNSGENRKYHFVAYQCDGSYWVNDPGNYRVQKYSTGHSYVTRLQWLGSSLSTAIDPGNINRVFYKFLEFNLDYLTGEWYLAKNWSNNISTKVYNTKYDNKPKTLSNGRTYGLFVKGATAEILELSNTGDTMRATGIFKSPGYFMEPDGSLIRYLRGTYGGTSTMQRFALTGFSGINPTWSATPTVLFTTPVLTKFDANGFPRTGSSIITSTGKVITFDAGAGIVNDRNVIIEPKPGTHLGAMQQGTVGGAWKWQTQRSTHIQYRGAYPDPGRFDVGNIVSDFAGGGMSINERSIFTNYHGEFWKNAQTSYHQHTLDNGLVVGMFGTDRTVTGFGNHSAAEMAGNTLTPQVVKATDNNLYYVHGDESDHSGLHWWKISRMNTLRQQEVVMNFPSAYVAPAQSFTELSSGIPFSDTLANNTAGWTKSPIYNNLNNIYSDYFKVTTGLTTYKKGQPGDVNAEFAATYNSTKTVSRDMGTINATNDWKVSGFIRWGGEANNAGTFQYLRVLDNTGKVLARLYVQSSGSGASTVTTVYGNGSVIASGLRSSMSLITGVLQPFSIVYNGGNITFVYDDYTPVVTSKFDPTASGLQPKTLQMYFGSQINLAAMDNKSMNIAAPRIYVDIL